MESKTHSPQDKRAYSRLKYLSEEKPVLKIISHDFYVLDISQGGLRFLNKSAVKLKDRITGKLVFTNGKLLDVEGTIEWEQDDEFGLLFSHLIPSDIFEAERRYVISHRL